MRDSEQAVRRVLDGLREVDAPAGMEARILLTVQQSVAAKAEASGRAVWRRANRPSSWMIGFAGCACCAGVLGGALLWMTRLDRSVPALRQPASLPKQSANLPTVATGASVLRVGAPVHSLTRAKLVQVSAVEASDLLALEEMRAPSHPAPLMPLTQQERLLLRVAQQGDDVQIAMLNPEVRHQQELQAKVEFQEFFEPSTPGKAKRSTNTIEKKGEAQ